MSQEIDQKQEPPKNKTPFSGPIYIYIKMYIYMYKYTLKQNAMQRCSTASACMQAFFSTRHVQLILAGNTRHPIDGLVQQLEIDSGPACMQACFFQLAIQLMVWSSWFWLENRFRASVRICECWIDSRPAFCQASKRAPVCPSAVLHWSRLNDSNIARTSHSRSSWSRWNPTIHSQCGAKGRLDTTRTL